jgi:hypothetical protein
LADRLQLYKHAAGVKSRTRRTTDRAADRQDVRVLEYDIERRLLSLLHAFERDVLVSLREARQHARIFLREKPLGMVTKK